jgi:hypothetical protein
MGMGQLSQIYSWLIKEFLFCHQHQQDDVFSELKLIKTKLPSTFGVKGWTI